MYVFLLLSLLSGMLEAGVVLAAYAEGLPVWAALAMALMYQLGNLLCVPEKCGRRLVIRLGIINLFVYAAGLWLPSLSLTAAQTALPALCIRGVQVALSSLCIQTVRMEQKSSCPTWLKRSFRIAGFVLAPLMVSFPSASMLLCAALPLAAAISGKDLPEPDKAPVPCGKTPARRISIVMVLHQMHYFVYTYIMPLAAAALTKSLYAAMAMYGLTWVVYLVPQWLAEKRGRYDPRRLFFICHTYLAIVMGMLAAAFFSGNIWMGTAAWLLTGLGGGSVFCIRQLTPRECNIALSENIGHFLGTAVALGVALTANPGLGAILTGLSCSFVCLALAAARYEISR